MSEVFFVDFHTHCRGGEKTPPDTEVLNIISTPLSEIDNISSANNIKRTLELHPWHGGRISGDFIRSAAEGDFIGIGEVGLDRLRGKLPLTEQIAVLDSAVRLAEELQKPLTIHCVKCFSELLELRKKLRWQVPTVIHYFRGNLKLAQQLWHQSDFLLSLPPGAPAELWDFLRAEKEYLQRIVLETDDPAGDIKKHYLQAAEKLQLPLEYLQKFMYQQYLKIYHD